MLETGITKEDIRALSRIFRLPTADKGAFACLSVITSYSIHYTKLYEVSPSVDPANCTGCGTCVAHCPAGAIEVVSQKALISPGTCIGCADCIVVCPEHTVMIDWNEAAPAVQRKMVEHAAGALRGKKEACLFVSFVMQISPYCDCYGSNDSYNFV